MSSQDLKHFTSVTKVRFSDVLLNSEEGSLVLGIHLTMVNKVFNSRLCATRTDNYQCRVPRCVS